MEETMYSKRVSILLAVIISMVFVFFLVTGYAQNIPEQKSEGSKKQEEVKFPTKNITLVCPFSPGGSTDAISRALALALQKQLGVQVVVDNMPGAGGKLAFTNVYNAKPDGYTLVLVDQPTMQIGEISGGKYKTERYTKIYGMTERSHAFSVRYDNNINNISDFIKSSIGKTVNTASGGLGTANELQVLLLSEALKLNLKPIPYSGAALELAALMSKETDACVASLENCITPHKDKSIRILAVMLDERHPMLPDVPSLKELGFPEGYAVSTTGIMGPPGIPLNIAKILEDATAKAIKDTSFIKWVQASGTVLKPFSADEYQKASMKQFNKVEKYSHIFKRNK